MSYYPPQLWYDVIKELIDSGEVKASQLSKLSYNMFDDDWSLKKAFTSKHRDGNEKVLNLDYYRNRQG